MMTHIDKKFDFSQRLENLSHGSSLKGLNGNVQRIKNSVCFESKRYTGSVTFIYCLNSRIWLNESMISDERGRWGIDSIVMMGFNTNVNWL